MTTSLRTTVLDLDPLATVRPPSPSGGAVEAALADLNDDIGEGAVDAVGRLVHDVDWFGWRSHLPETPWLLATSLPDLLSSTLESISIADGVALVDVPEPPAIVRPSDALDVPGALLVFELEDQRSVAVLLDQLSAALMAQCTARLVLAATPGPATFHGEVAHARLIVPLRGRMDPAIEQRDALTGRRRPRGLGEVEPGIAVVVPAGCGLHIAPAVGPVAWLEVELVQPSQVDLSAVVARRLGRVPQLREDVPYRPFSDGVGPDSTFADTRSLQRALGQVDLSAELEHARWLAAAQLRPVLVPTVAEVVDLEQRVDREGLRLWAPGGVWIEERADGAPHRLALGAVSAAIPPPMATAFASPTSPRGPRRLDQVSVALHRLGLLRLRSDWSPVPTTV